MNTQSSQTLKASSSLSRGGTTIRPILPENTATQEIETDILPSETKSEPVSKPERKLALHAMGVIGTQCCGLHSVTGFQYHNNGIGFTASADKGQPVRLEDFVYSLQQAYKKNEDLYMQYSKENDKAVLANQHSPHPPSVFYSLVRRRAGMLLFTWNDDIYLPGAQSLATQIKDAGLGECTITEQALNPNSWRLIRAMVWALDFQAYDKYVEEHKLHAK